MFDACDTIKIGDTWYMLGEPVEEDGSNLKMGEYYIEHTQENPDRYEVFQKDYETESIENSWKIISQSQNTYPGISIFKV